MGQMGDSLDLGDSRVGICRLVVAVGSSRICNQTLVLRRARVFLLIQKGDEMTDHETLYSIFFGRYRLREKLYERRKDLSLSWSTHNESKDDAQLAVYYQGRIDELQRTIEMIESLMD
jgi:hypothetical protein